MPKINPLFHDLMTKPLRPFIARHAASLIAWLLVCLGLYLTSLHSFLLFHVAAEGFSIVIAFSIFTIAWNTRRLSDNGYVLFLGIAFLFIGFVDVLHTLAFRGMGLFGGYDTDLATQLWIIARGIEALSFLAAAWMVGRRPNVAAVLSVYAAATALLLAAAFTGVFPDCYIEGRGLTPFKIASEYVICIILIASLVLLIRRRERFDRQILVFIVWSILWTIVSELAFTFYVDVYGLLNLAGHFFKIFAFYYMYRAIVVTNLKNPYRLLFFDLQKNREELETIFDTSPVMIFYKDMENRFIRVNQALASTTGLPKEAIEGRTAPDIFPEQARVFEEADREVIATGRPKTGIIEPLSTPTGTRWVQTDKIPYRDKEGRIAGTIGFAVDVTEQRQAEWEITTTRRFLEIANRHTDMQGMLGEFAAEIQTITGCEAIGIRIRDEEGYIPYQACLGFNSEFLEMENMLCIETDRCLCISVITGKTDPKLPACTEGGSYFLNNTTRYLASVSEEVKGRMRNVCPRMGYESIALIPIRAEKSILGLVHLADRREGMVPPELVRTLEKIAATLGVGTQRALAEAALRAARDRAEWLARLPEENPRPILRAADDGNVLYCNPAAAEAEGWKCEAGKPLPKPLIALLQQAMTDGKDAQADIIMGERYYNVQVVFFPAERYANMYGRDITARKKAEDALRERSRELEAAIRELESFSYSISHDLRAPLRAIDGFSRMLLKTHGDAFDDEARRRFNVIRENAQKMGQLIDDLLAFSRSGRQAITPAALDMERLAGEIWQEQCAANPGRRMQFRNGTLPGACGDRTLIRQVLVNLLANAVKFTAGREEAVVEIGGYRQEGEIVYYVRDNGIGFDMAYHDRLFEVFQRLHDDSYEGTGVGLAIVRQIVTRHGGRVWGEGREGEGATFYFTLPDTDGK
jgi:PAS domain S-box-containing protein